MSSAIPRTWTWRTDVQGLRAIAVCLVIAGHAGLSATPGGFIGVDVFFVLSGFLITSLLLREAQSDGKVSISRFYARRARRILPAATVTTLAVLAFCAVAVPEARTDDAANDAGWAAVFLANVHFAKEAVDYFSSPAPSPFQHYWSLSVEEQFYVVWPLLVLLVAVVLTRIKAGRRTKRVVAALAAMVALGSLLWSLHTSSGAAASAAYFSTPARAYELAGGALLACLAGRLPTLNRYARAALGLVGVGIIVYGTVGFSEHTTFPSWHALVPVAGTLALLAAGPDTPTGWVLSKQPFRYLGDISYSLYLWHWPILILAPSVIPGGGWRQMVIMLALILGASATSYHFVETPFQKRRVPVISHGRKALALWPAALALALVAGTSAQTYAGHVVAVRKAEAREWYRTHVTEALAGEGVHRQIRTAVSLAKEGAPLPPDVSFDPKDSWGQEGGYCYVPYGATTRKPCAYGDKDAKRTVAVVGDSHAGMWLPALDKLAQREHVRLVPILKLACAPYDVYQPADNMPQKECDDFRDWQHKRLEKMQPDAIILGARGLLNVQDGHDGKSKEEQWRTAVHRSVTYFQGITPDVRVLSDVPALKDPENCVSDARNRLEDCVSDPTSPEAKSNALTKAGLKGTKARFIDTVELVCADRCPLVVGDRILHYDESHVTLTWVSHVTDAFGRRIGSLAHKPSKHHHKHHSATTHA